MFKNFNLNVEFFLLQVLSGLAVQYKKLDVETKSHLRTVKEQAQINTKIIEEAKQKILQGNDISNYFVEIEATVKESQGSSEELRKKYDIVIYRVKDCCSQAKAGYERNEHKADLAEKVKNIVTCVLLRFSCVLPKMVF